jgi:hypothetical protein
MVITGMDEKESRRKSRRKAEEKDTHCSGPAVNT